MRLSTSFWKDKPDPASRASASRMNAFAGQILDDVATDAATPGSDLRDALDGAYVAKGLVVNAGDYDSITEAVAALSDGSTLWVPGGTYTENVVVSGLSNVTVLAHGATLTPANGALPALSAQGCSDVQVTGLRVAATATVRNTTGHGIAVGSSDNVTVSDCAIDGVACFGITVAGSTNVRVFGCMVRDTLADGVHINAASSRVTVMGCQTDETGDDGIAVVSYQSDGAVCTDIVVTGNIVRHSKARGLSMVGGTRGVYSGNIVVATKMAGIWVGHDVTFATYGVADLTITGNTVRDANTYSSPTSDNAGIHIQSASASYPTTGVRVLNNTLAGSRVRGIYAIGSGGGRPVTDLTVTGNTVRDTAANSGIQVENIENVVVAGNIVTGVGNHGVQFANCAGVTRVEDNHVHDANLLLGSSNGYHGTTGAGTVFVRRNLVTESADRIVASFNLASLTGALYLDANTPVSGKGTSLPAIERTPQRTTRPIVENTAAPTAGTWSRGQIVWNTNAAPSTTPGWVCTTAGTFGTLTGVTATTTASSATITVSDATNLAPGMTITIAGVTGSKVVRSVSGTTVILTATCDAAVTGAAVAYVTPVFKAMSNLVA